MYINYLHDRQLLGYAALKDTRCGIELLFISDLVERQIKIIIFIFLLEAATWFGNPEPANANDSWFSLPGAQGFTMTAPLNSPRHSGHGAHSGGNGNGPNRNSNVGNDSSNPSTPKQMNHGLASPAKTKKQKKEDKINAQRRKEGKPPITVMIRDDLRFFAENEQLRDTTS